MAITVQTNPVVEWPVKIKKPIDGGNFQTHKITAKFQIVGIERTKELLGTDDMTLVSGIAQQDKIGEFLSETWVGWLDGHVQDEDKQAIEYSEEIRDQLLDIPYFRLAILEAYGDCIQGRKAKN